MSKSIMQDERLDRPTGQYTAYRRKKEHIDREAWEKPCSVCGGKTTLYQQTEEAQAELEKRLRGNEEELIVPGECGVCLQYEECLKNHYSCCDGADWEWRGQKEE